MELKEGMDAFLKNIAQWRGEAYDYKSRNEFCFCQ